MWLQKQTVIFDISSLTSINLYECLANESEQTEKSTFSCTSIRKFVQSFEINSPTEWIRDNCESLLKETFPTASCEQISRVFVSCFDENKNE